MPISSSPTDFSRNAPLIVVDPAPPQHVNSSRRHPLWVWWHLLSLDAPTVAVVWCWFFGAILQLSLSWVSLAILALGTWCVYVADRLLDGWRSTDMSALRDRHWFYLRHRKPFLIAWVFAAAPLAYLILFRVDARVRIDDIALCLAGVAYFLLIHGGVSRPIRPRLLPIWLPKEFAVGFLFAIATAVPAFGRLAAPGSLLPAVQGLLLPAVLMFGTLCWLNCVAIQTWEDAESGGEIVNTILAGVPPKRASGLTAYLGTRLSLFAGTVFVLSLSLAIIEIGDNFDPLFCSITFSAVIFLGLVHYSRRFSALSLRIAADAALLTPLLFVLAVH